MRSSRRESSPTIHVEARVPESSGGSVIRRAPSFGMCATMRLPTGRASARAVGMSAISWQPGPFTLRRVTGPRNVCVITSPAIMLLRGASPFAEVVSCNASGLIRTSTGPPLGGRGARRTGARTRWGRIPRSERRRFVASSRFIVPMYSATNAVAVAVCISLGVPICPIRPPDMTATRSVTSAKLIPIALPPSSKHARAATVLRFDGFGRF